MKKNIILISLGSLIGASLVGIGGALYAVDAITITRCTTITGILTLASIGSFFIATITPKDT